MERKKRTKKKEEQVGNYFTTSTSELEFISSGCTLLDLVLGGGWPKGRVGNIVGDKSTGKTLLAMEACANFLHKYPRGKPIYQEGEHAFDEGYSRSLGIPIKDIEIIFNNTCEFMFKNVARLAGVSVRIGEEKQKKKVEKIDVPCLYIIDSLDSLSVSEESLKEFDEPGFAGSRKALYMSQMIPKITGIVEDTEIHLMIISQVRDKIGVVFGKKHTRSGGKALDFYASQVLWLTELGKIKQTKNGIERVVGIRVKAKAEKNKVGLPFRECEFPIYFFYGIKDYEANLNFLDKYAREVLDGITDDFELRSEKDKKDKKKIPVNKIIKYIEKDDDNELVERLKQEVIKKWHEIETSFMPKRKKYL
jgi:recombination protein RecA